MFCHYVEQTERLGRNKLKVNKRSHTGWVVASGWAGEFDRGKGGDRSLIF